MRAEIVENNNVARPESGNEELFDIGEEALAVDRAVEQARRVDAVVPQRGQEGRSLPITARDLADEPLAAWRPAGEAGHVGLGPGFVDEDETTGIYVGLVLAPASAMTVDIGPLLLARDKRLFLNVMPARRKKRLIIEVSDATPRSARRRSQSA